MQQQSLRVFQAHYDQVQAECLRRVPVPDPVTGRWKRPRPEHAEGSAQPVKEPPDEEDNLPQTLKKEQATSAAAIPAKTSTSCGTLDELAEGLGSFHESARALASCLQKHDVPRRTDQSMIEAAKCMFHKLLGEVRDDLDRVTSQSQGGPYAEIKQNKQRCLRTAILEENPCPRSEQQSGKSVHQTSTETPLPQSSAGILEQVVEGDPRKQPPVRSWRVEIRIQDVVVRYDNTEFALQRSGAKGQDSKFSDAHWTLIRLSDCRQAVP